MVFPFPAYPSRGFSYHSIPFWHLQANLFHFFAGRIKTGPAEAGPVLNGLNRK